MNYTHNDRRLLREVNGARTVMHRGAYMKATKRYDGAGVRNGILTHGRARSNIIDRILSGSRAQRMAKPNTLSNEPRERNVIARSTSKRSGAGVIARAIAFIFAIVESIRADKSETSSLKRKLGAVLCAATLIGAFACVVLPAYMNTGRMTVALDIDGEIAHIDTFDNTVGDLLSRYAVTLGEGDVLYPAASARLENNMSIRLRRAISVYVEADGQTRKLSLLSGTVEDAMRAAGVNYTDADELSYSKYSKLLPGMHISLVRVETEHEFSTETLAFRIKRVEDASLTKGEEKITQRGVEGKKEIQYRLTYKDGELVSREVVGERIITAPKTRIVSIGTKIVVKAAPKKTETASAKATATPKPAAISKNDIVITVNGVKYPCKEQLRMTVTAYTHTGNRTATGTWPGKGTIAVDKSVIPLGTKLYVKGYGFGVASDVGVRGNQIDVFMDTYDQCIHWGRKRNVSVYILK